MEEFTVTQTTNLKWNPFESIGVEWMLVTAGNSQKANTMTASWGGVGVLWSKNVAFIFVRDSRYTKEFIDANNTFSLTFFKEEHKKQKEALRYLGAVSGRAEDKLAKVGFHICYEEETPFVKEGNFILICKKLSATKLNPEQFLDTSIDSTWYQDKDYHTMYVGQIIKILEKES